MASTAFETVIRLQFDRRFGPEAVKRRHIEIARNGLAAFVARQQHKPIVHIETDGHSATSEESVKPYGIIAYRFNRVGEAAQYAIEYLIAYVRRAYSGDYAKSFFVSVDGKFIPAGIFNQRLVPARAEIIIGNTKPFNRKIDVQRVGGRPLSFRIPPGLYDAAAAAVRRRYGAIVDVKRDYNIKFPGKYVLRHEQRYLSGSRQGRQRGRKGQPVESPGLVITAKV